MNSMHHPATMAKNYGFLPIDVEGQAQKLFSAAPSLGCAKFGQMKTLGPVKWSLSGHQGLASARVVRASQ